MNKITLAEAIELIRTTTAVPLLTFDELLETSGGNGVDEEFSFWMDLYQTFPHPNGGEIYFQLYVDCSVNQEGKLSISFDDSHRALKTEELKIEGVDELYEITGDLLSSNHAEFAPLFDLINPASDNFGEAKTEQLKANINAQFVAIFGENYSVDSIKAHKNYCAA